MEDPSTEARLEAARVAILGGDRGEAFRQWREVLERHPDHPEASRLLRRIRRP